MQHFYLTACNKLIRRNVTLDTYQIMNVLGERQYITCEDFVQFKSKQLLKKQKFNELMNKFYKDKTETWSFEKETFRNLEQFQIIDGTISNYSFDNYKNHLSIPFHTIQTHEKYTINSIIVYYQGRVCYHSIGSQYDFRGQLYDFKSKKFLKWVKLKHCSPILNMSTGRIL